METSFILLKKYKAKKRFTLSNITVKILLSAIQLLRISSKMPEQQITGEKRDGNPSWRPRRHRLSAPHLSRRKKAFQRNWKKIYASKSKQTRLQRTGIFQCPCRMWLKSMPPHVIYLFFFNTMLTWNKRGNASTDIIILRRNCLPL